MKKIMLMLALMPLSAFAVTTTDYARVVSATPQMERVRVDGHCRDVSYTERQEAPAAEGMGGTILGGVVGGLLGNQVGGGNGRSVATAAGAITGAIVGGKMSRNGPETRDVTRTRQECEQDSWSEVATGYRVTYEYKGQRDTVVMPRDPGRRLEMRVTAEPVVR